MERVISKDIRNPIRVMLFPPNCIDEVLSFIASLKHVEYVITDIGIPGIITEENSYDGAFIFEPTKNYPIFVYTIDKDSWLNPILPNYLVLEKYNNDFLNKMESSFLEFLSSFQ